ncbi:MAG TPA: hypothetical protein VIL18_08785, partial [Longimicrobiales bacterium]
SAWTSIPLDSLLDGLMVLLRFQVVSSNPFYRRPVGPFAFTQKKVRYPRERLLFELGFEFRPSEAAIDSSPSHTAA